MADTSEEQQFCLRWNNFQSNITTQFGALRNDEDFVDVTLACEGQRIEAHKVVLSACSPFFKELFKSNPCPHPIIFMRDVEMKHIVSLLEFMYAGEVKVAQAHLAGFLRTAESLQIRGLTDASKNQKNCNKLTKSNEIEKETVLKSEKILQHDIIKDSSASSINHLDRSNQISSVEQSQPRSPSVSNDEIPATVQKRPLLQNTPPPTKKICKTETVVLSDNEFTQNNDLQFTTNNHLMDSEKFPRQNSLHTELDLSTNLIEPKTEPVYIGSDDEQINQNDDDLLSDSMLQFDDSDMANSNNINSGYGKSDLNCGVVGELSQDSNQGAQTSTMKHVGRRYRERLWSSLTLDLSRRNTTSLSETILASQTKVANINWPTSTLTHLDDTTHHHQANNNHSSGVVKLGEGIEICKEQLLNVKWNDYRKLTRSLATILFSQKELATCSVTGQRWSRAGIDKRPVKPALDRAKVQAIISYVAAKFPMIEVSRIRQVLAYKCKENSTAFKMKALNFTNTCSK